MNSLRATITAIREEHNTDKRIKMLQRLNSSLPRNIRLQLPSLITNAYIRKALDIIEEKAVLTA
ncbi:MAG: hypothetical protein ACRD99_01440 [Nitrososphaera sp.]